MSWAEAIGEQFSFDQLATISDPKLLEARCDLLRAIIDKEIVSRVEAELIKSVLPALERAGFMLTFEREQDGTLWLNPINPEDSQFLAIDIVASGYFGKLPEDNDS
jgi:hypothetical protein